MSISGSSHQEIEIRSISYIIFKMISPFHPEESDSLPNLRIFSQIFKGPLQIHDYQPHIAVHLPEGSFLPHQSRGTRWNLTLGELFPDYLKSISEIIKIPKRKQL